jgi:hypothetical protein
MLNRYSLEVQADDQDDALDQAGQATDLGEWNDDTSINGDGELEIQDAELIAD